MTQCLALIMHRSSMPILAKIDIHIGLVVASVARLTPLPPPPSPAGRMISLVNIIRAGNIIRCHFAATIPPSAANRHSAPLFRVDQPGFLFNSKSNFLLAPSAIPATLPPPPSSLWQRARLISKPFSPCTYVTRHSNG